MEKDHSLNAASDKPRVIIVDDMHSAILDLKNDFDIKYVPNITTEQAIDEVAYYDILVVRSKLKITADLLQRWPKIKLIARAGAGMDNIDEEAAREQNIHVLNCGEGNRMAVAEHTVGMMLGLTSKIVKAHKEVSQLMWDREGNRGTEVGDKTVGIVGFGNAGSAVAQLLTGFNCRVVAYDKYKTNYSLGMDHVEEVELNELMEQSDIVSFHVPLSEETKEWICAEWFAKLNKPIFLLNMSRGGIMNLNDVKDALEQNALLGFGTDVLPNEHLSNLCVKDRGLLKELCKDDRVIITPHVGGWTEESYRKISIMLGGKIKNKWRELSARNLK